MHKLIQIILCIFVHINLIYLSFNFYHILITLYTIYQLEV